MEMAMTMTGRTNDTFEIDKAVAVLGYLVEHTKESMYSLMKMMYLADKLHLEKFGRFIVGDYYCALKQGPVPSHTYNMMKHLRGDERTERFAVADRHFAYRADHYITLLEPVDLDELSGSEVTCLEEVVNIYDKFGKWAVKDLSHDDAWQDAWASKSFFKKSVSIGIEKIARQLDNGDVLLEHIRDRHPGEASLPTGRLQ